MNFIEQEIVSDLENGRYSRVQTRQPPEPSGYLHIAHVRGIMLNYGLAEKYGGKCCLRFDDTNPLKESKEFIEAIKRDVKWLGYKWHKIKYATDYFSKNYNIAVKLIKDGKAYVCDLSKEELIRSRGDLHTPGTESPFRQRSVAENLSLFTRMKLGEFEQGSRCLRAKIDMAHPNLLMRDPVIYRIQYAPHHRIGRKWNVYPTYDFSHPLDDTLEGVTHSICGSEFIEHGALYDWVNAHSGLNEVSRQIEYFNLYLDNVIIGKRHIKKLVEDGVVSGFDDPRLYTLAGLRRRGVLPESVKSFIEAIGMGKEKSVIDPRFFDSFIRSTLNEKARRVMAVLQPLELEITNYPKGQEEDIWLEDFPQQENSTRRAHKFCRNLLIERADFEVNPPPKYHRLTVGSEVRLKGAYIIKCTGYKLNEAGEVVKVFAEYDPATKSGEGTEQRKVKAAIHFLSKKHAGKCKVLLYGNLFEPAREHDPDTVNGLSVVTTSKTTVENVYVEKLKYTKHGRYQFIRNGYFCLDTDSKPGALVFNRTITLKEGK